MNDLFIKILRWLGILGLVAFFVEVLGPHIFVGFASDDFSLMIEDAAKQWYYSSDHLYRPLRNLILHYLPSVLGMNPLWYRGILVLAVAATLVLLFVLMRQLGVSRAGSIAALLVFAYYPRHEAVYYFWSASQDAFMALFFLLTLSMWMHYRSTGSKAAWWLSVLAFAFSLGFKEPAVCAPLLIVLWDFAQAGRPWKETLRFRYWHVYLGFAVVLSLFAGFVIWYPEGRLRVHDPYAIYGYTGPLRGILGWVRTIVNLILPFSREMSLRNVHLFHVALLGFIALALFALQRWLRLGSALLTGMMWIGLTIIPTSMFVNSNGDQYLYLPSFGIAAFLGYAVDKLLNRGPSVRAATVTALAAYSIFGGLFLRNRQEYAAQAASEVRRVVTSIRDLIPPDDVRELTLINVPSTNRYYAILANGTDGALINAGYSRRLQVWVNPEVDDPPQHDLIRQALACRGGASFSHDKRTAVILPQGVVEVDPACASASIAADRANRPHAWNKLTGGN